jgi:NAD+ diphosphatase
MIFPKIAPAVIVGVTNGDKILLTKYANREYKRYALIAGFNEIGETIEETVKREVMEEAGLHVKNIRYYKSQPWGFDSNLLMGFFCEVDGSKHIVMDEHELSEAEWVNRSDIPDYKEHLSLTHEMMLVLKNGDNKEKA